MRSEVGRWDVWFNVSFPSFGKFVLSMKLILWGDVGTAKGAGGGGGSLTGHLSDTAWAWLPVHSDFLYNPTLCSNGECTTTS